MGIQHLRSLGKRVGPHRLLQDLQVMKLKQSVSSSKQKNFVSGILRQVILLRREEFMTMLMLRLL